jgi:hypothetical protein
LNPYIQLGGWQTTQWPPFHIAKNRALTWILPADAKALAELCDRFFAVPSRGAVRYRPLGALCGVTLSMITEATTSDPRAGSTRETDLMVWVPVVRDGQQGPEPAVFCPWLFVDHAPAVWTGRELFGLPKEWAAFSTLPTGSELSEEVEVSAFELDREGGTLAPRPLLRVIPGAPLGVAQVAAGAAHAALRTLYAGLDLRSLVSKHQQARFASLKQLPSATRPGAAAYSAVVEMRARVDEVRTLRHVAQEVTVDLTGGPLHPVAATLGWDSPRQTALGSFFADYSFTLLGADVLWSVGGI